MKDPHIRLFVSLLLLCLITLHESSEGSVKKTNSIEFKKNNTAGNISQAEKIQNLLDVLRKQSAAIQSLEDVVMSLKEGQQKGTTKPSLKTKGPASHVPKSKSTPTVKNNAIISTPTSAKTVPGSMPDPDTQNEPTAPVSPASETTTATTNKPVTTPSKSATAQAEKIQNILDVLRKQSAAIQSLEDVVMSLKEGQQKGTTKPSLKTKGPASHVPKSKSTPTVKNNAIISTPTSAKTVPGSMPDPDTQNEPTAPVSPASETTTATTNKPVTTPSKSATAQAEKIQNILDVLRKQSAAIQSLEDVVMSLKEGQQKGTTKPSLKTKGPASHGPKSKSTPTVKNNTIISTPTPAKTGSMPDPDPQNEPTASVSPASETTTANTNKRVTTPSKSATGDSTTSHTTSPHIARITTQSKAGSSSKSSTNEPTTTQISTASRTMRTTDKKPGLQTTFSPTQPKSVKLPKTSTSRTTLKKNDRGTVTTILSEKTATSMRLSPKLSKKTSAKNDSEVRTNSSAEEKPLSSTTKETPIPKNDGSSDDKNNTKQRESTSDDSSFLHQVNRFPALFMAALFFIVLIYFGYHNRNTIHKVVKKGYSGSKQGAKGYVKVKLDDVIDLPRDANRQYIY